MRKSILTILILLVVSMSVFSSELPTKTAYVKLPKGTPSDDITVVSLVGDSKSVRHEASTEELDKSIQEESIGSLFTVLKLVYTPKDASHKLKFAIIYEYESEKYTALLSPDTSSDTLEDMKKNYDSDNPTKILDNYLSNWKNFPGIVLEKNMNLFAIPIDDDSTNILIRLIDEGIRYEGNTGGINPGEGKNEFEMKLGSELIIDGDGIKDSNKNDFIDLENGILGYYEADYIKFKPHNMNKIDDEDEIVIIDSENNRVELPKNTFTELYLVEDSKVQIWNSNINKNGKANGQWYFTIIEGNIENKIDGNIVTVVEDVWTTAGEEISMSSNGNGLGRSRTSNIKINNSGDGNIHFEIISIKE